MKSGRPIDISKSSLISLKAELVRKQEEVKQAKLVGDYVVRSGGKKVTKEAVNPGVEERALRDAVTLAPEEVDLLKKSKEVLEIKASLYDKLQKRELVAEGESQYLVDFNEKALQEPTLPSSPKEEILTNEGGDSLDDDEDDYCSDPENDWVEYVDCLGRTRKCLRRDLRMMKEKDEDLAGRMGKGRADEERERKEGSGETQAGRESGVREEGVGPPSQPPSLELMSNDMHKELLRQKWEEKEQELANKKEIHYEDVLFDEARGHGVGYFRFSTDEEKRASEQRAFRRLREETEARQKEAKALRQRREEQRTARLIAARQRQRARLGLPPIETPEFSEEPVVVTEVEPEKEEEPSTVESLEENLKRAAHVRPWDVGKDGAKQPVLMSQEEWVETRRKERQSEFAPSYKEDISTPSTSYTRPPPCLVRPWRDRTPAPPMKRSFPSEEQPLPEETVERERKGAEVPPPPTFEYYNGSGGKREKTTGQSLVNTAKSIEEGLKYLRELSEKRNEARVKGEL